MKKRILSLFMALVLCLTFLPVSAFAEAESDGEGNGGSIPTKVENVVPSVSEGGDSGKTENEADNAPVVENEEPDKGDIGMSGNGGIGGETGGTGGGVLVGGNEGQGGEGGMSGNEGDETGGDGNDQPGGGVFEPIDEGNDTPAFEEAEKTEIWCIKKSDSIGRAYDGTTDGSTIMISMWFTTDGTDEIAFTEGVDFTAVKTFDSADAGDHTVSVEITLIGEAANQYKLKAGEEKFEIKGTIDQAVPKLTVSLSQTTCETGEKILPLLSISGVEEEAAVTYYYTQFKSLVGNSEYEGTYIPVLDENTSIDVLDEENGNTYYIYAKTTATANYKEGMSEPVELTIVEKPDPAVIVMSPNGADQYFDSLPAALEAAQNGNIVRLKKDVTVNASDLEDGFTAENALAISGKRIELDLNGYVLESDDVPMTVKNGATLYLGGMGTENTEKATNVALNLNLRVEKGATFGCSVGRIKKLQLQSAGEGNYNLSLAASSRYCTFGSLSAEDDAAYVDDVLKVKHAGMALHAENDGADVRIARSTPINQIASECSSFYVGACSDHETGEDNTCIYCGTEVEVDTCIAHATVPYSDYVWHLQTLDDIVYQTTQWIMVGTVTVKFLTDVTTDKTFRITQISDTEFIFDLDGHTLSGNLDVPVAEMDFLYGTSSVAIQNGTFQNTGSGAALKLSYGATTLKNVNVTGNLILTGRLLSSASYVPTFLGGGEFSKITLEADSGRALFSMMLPKGYYFARIGEKNRIPGEDLSAGESIENITVLPCNHKDADGNYVFVRGDDVYHNYYCSICGNICPHANRTPNENGSQHCENCGLDLGAVKIDQIDKTETYYPTFDSVSIQNKIYITIKVLGDQNTSTAILAYLPNGTFDLNGCTLTRLNDDRKLADAYIAAAVTFKNTAASPANYVCSYIAVNDTSGLLIIPATQNNITISAVVFQDNGSADLAGGSFGSIKIDTSSSKKLTDMLASGYYFADTATGAPAAMYDADGNIVSELTNVTVTKCSHNEAVCGPDGLWKCPCGQRTFVASVTMDGATDYYTDLQDAFNAADGGTVKLLQSVIDVTVNIEKPFTFDLNGYNVYSLTVNSIITLKDSTGGKSRIKEWLRVPSGMTIGDLLEDGYAFKDADSDTWKPGTYQTVGNVSVKRVPIDSVTAVNPTIVVEYGKTSEVTLTATVVLSDEEGTFSCQWYRAGGTLQPVEGVTGSSYQLPDDLSGNCTYCLVVKKDGYEKECEFSVTVTPISIADADVTVKNPTYSGAAQTPKLTVKLGEKVLTENKDYTVAVAAQTDAGSYQLTINGRGGYNGAIENVDWKIKPMKIDHVMFAKDISKTYDGNAEFDLVPADKASYLKFYGEYTMEVSVPAEAYEISNVRFAAKNADGEIVDSPEAGSKDWITFTITLNSSNYVLQGFYDEQPASSKTENQYRGADFTINKATVNGLWNLRLEQHVFNDLARTYEVDLQPILDEILKWQPDGRTYGTVTYGDTIMESMTADYYDLDTAKIENGKLILPIKAASGVKNGYDIGALTVNVNSTNFMSFDLYINVVARDKFVPDQSGVTFSATDINYGQTLNDSQLTVTGSMKDIRTGEEIKGTFAWKDGTIQPDAGSYEAEWMFTPAEEYEEYATATGTVTITVHKVDSTFTAPTANTLTYNGHAQFLLSEGSTQDGTMLYRLGEDGEFADSVPTGKDAGTYTVYYKVAGDGNHTDTEEVSITVTIDPMRIKGISNIDPVTKAYDGTADAPIDKSALRFYSETESNIVLPDDAFTITNARFTRLQADNSYQDSPEAGEGKSLSFTLTLTNSNYVFIRNKQEYTTEDCDIATDDVKMFTIRQADAPTNIQTGMLNVINGTTLKYTYDAEQLLPDAPKGTYGTVFYAGITSSNFETGYAVNSCQVGISSGVLTLTIDAQNGGKVGKIGSVTIYVTTDNYETFSLPVDLYAINQIASVADGDITASEITYGQPLSESIISGKMKDPETGKTVTGTFSWEDGTLKFNAGSRKANWTFTPDAPEYAATTGTIRVKVNPKSIEGAIVTLEDSFVYDGTEKAPKIISVVLDGVTLVGPGRTGDYGFSYNRTTEVGTYYDDLSIGGQNNYTGELRFTWSITPREVAPAITVADGTYNGGNPVEPAVTLTDDLGNTIDPSEYTVTYSNNINAGTATVTITDNDGGNYVLGTASTTFTIGKAAAPAAMTGALTIINGLHKTYSFELSTLLAKLTSPSAYGAITYGKPVTDLGVGSFVTLVDSRTGALTLEVIDRSSDEEGQFGTIKVAVTTDNYQEFELTINVIAENKIPPQVDGAVTAADITYGQTLNESRITGRMKHPDTGDEITGTFAWKDGTVKPDAGSYYVEWVFTPDESYGGIYAVVTGFVNVEVNQAVQYGTVSMADYTYGETPSTPTLTGRTGDPDAPVTYYYNDGSAVKKWNINTPPALNVGNYQMYARIGQTANYYEYNTLFSEFAVVKAMPSYTIPTGLTAKYGQTLSDVTLPDGWSWMDGSESVGDASTTAKTFKAKFTPADTDNYNAVENIELEVTVNKADGGNLATIDLSQKYTDAQEHTFEADWTALPEGQNWIFGSTYSRSEGSNAQLPRLENTIDGSKLIYVIAEGKAGDMVTLTLKASCDNYEDFTITLRIALLDRDDQAALTITGNTTVVYGDTLKLTATGGSGTGDVTYRIDDTISTGAATIDPVTGVLTTVRVGSVSIIASKAGDNEYKDITSAPFVIMIVPAASTGEPSYKKITASGKTLKDAGLTLDGSTLNPNAGKLEWLDDQNNVLPDDTIVEANKAYRWRFTPDDTNYTALTGEATLYRVYTIQANAETGGSISPSGNVSVNDGDDQVFTITPDKGYAVSNVKIDGRSIGAVKSYTFEDVSRSHTIEAIFMKANGNPQTGVFVDAATGRYYDDEMDWVLENGID